MKKITTITLLFIITFLLVSCDDNEPITYENPFPAYCEVTREDGVFKCTKGFYSMDTYISTTFYINHNEENDILALFDGVYQIISQYDQLFHAYEPFDGINNVYAINRLEGEIVIDELLFDAIEYALENQNVDPEAETLLFNIAYEPVLRLWHDARYDNECISGFFYDSCPIPSDEVLNLDYPIDPNDIVLNRDQLTIEFLKPGMGIDLGGFAKGYVSMIIQEYLAEYDINYIVNLGASNVLVGGENISNPSGEYYTIGLTTPSYESFGASYYGAVKLLDGYSVVTSGSYQRYIRNSEDPEDNTYYHHIIDPRTNKPGGEALAVSIITNNTALSDILSTAIFLMDYDYALNYVNQTEGLEAIWYFGPNDIRMSENFEDYFIWL